MIIDDLNNEVVKSNNKYANLKNYKGNSKRGRKKTIPIADQAKMATLGELSSDKDVVAKKFNVTKQTVYNVMQRMKEQKNLSGKNKEFLDRWEQAKQIMGDDILELAEWIYKSITVEDVQKSSLPQKVTSMAILTDKALLLKGEATQRVAFDGFSDSDLEKIIKNGSIDAEVVKPE